MTPRPKLLGTRGAPVLLLEGGPLGYTPGADGALTGVESALSSLPICPCYVAPYRVGPLGDRCGMPTRHLQRYGARSLVCSAGHVFEPDLRAKQGREWSPREHEQARGALAAEESPMPANVATVFLAMAREDREETEEGLEIALTPDERAFLRGDHDGERLLPNDPRREVWLAVADSLIALGLIERVEVFNFFGNDFAHKRTDLGRAVLAAEKGTGS